MAESQDQGVQPPNYTITHTKPPPLPLDPALLDLFDTDVLDKFESDNFGTRVNASPSASNFLNLAYLHTLSHLLTSLPLLPPPFLTATLTTLTTSLLATSPPPLPPAVSPPPTNSSDVDSYALHLQSLLHRNSRSTAPTKTTSTPSSTELNSNLHTITLTQSPTDLPIPMSLELNESKRGLLTITDEHTTHSIPLPPVKSSKCVTVTFSPTYFPSTFLYPVTLTSPTPFTLSVSRSPPSQTLSLREYYDVLATFATVLPPTPATLTLLHAIASSTRILSHTLTYLIELTSLTGRGLPKPLPMALQQRNNELAATLQNPNLHPPPQAELPSHPSHPANPSHPAHPSHAQVAQVALHLYRFSETLTSPGLTTSSNCLILTSTTSIHTVCYLTHPCPPTAPFLITFTLLADIANDESSLFGLGTTPLADFSYATSPHLSMYRSYNGNVYSRGTFVRGVSRRKISRSDSVTVIVNPDGDKGRPRTVDVSINGEKQEKVFEVKEGEDFVYAAVGFYGSNRKVRLDAVQRGNEKCIFRHDTPDVALGTAPGVTATDYDIGQVLDGEREGHWTEMNRQVIYRKGRKIGLTGTVTKHANNGPAYKAFYCEDGDWERRRTPTQEDLEMARQEVNGWICATCQFITLPSLPVCKLCAAPFPTDTHSDKSDKADDPPPNRDDPSSAVALILEDLADLSITQSQSAIAQSRTNDPSSSHSLDPPPLTTTFGLEPSPQVFSLLHSFLSSPDPLILLSALRILTANFVMLTFPELPPPPPRPLRNLDLTSLKETLENLLQLSATGHHAAECLAGGFELLYPSPSQRAHRINGLLADHSRAISFPIPENNGKFTLLKRLLVNYASTASINKLLPPIVPPTPENPFEQRTFNTESNLVKCAFETAIIESIAALDRDPAEPAIPTPLTPSISQFLNTILLHITIPMRVAPQTPPDDCDAHSSDPPPPPDPTPPYIGHETHPRLAVAYMCYALHSCTILANAVNSALAGPKSRTFAALEPFLKSSLLHQILPVAATIANNFSGQMWFATPVLPFLVKLVSAINSLNAANDAAGTSESALLQVEHFELHSSTEGHASNSSVSVNGRFDAKAKSDEIAIEEDGKLIKSMSSTSQHCLVDIGCRRGKCSWEFKLISDSQNDECSAFGVATKPVVSSSYESSTNMWVRRSFNGQLYHGTSAGFGTLSRIHPGDVIKIEVDMDLREMRFYKNGVDEGVAFTDLSGEVFPIICTYRSGIEVALLDTHFSSTSLSSPYGANFLSRIVALTTANLNPSGGGTVVDEGSGFVHSEKTYDGQWCTAINKHGWRSGVHAWEVVLRCGDTSGFVTIGVLGVGETSPPPSPHSNWHVGQSPSGLSYALKGDGSLWHNGKKVGVNFGDGTLNSLKADAVLTVHLDLNNKSLSFSHNGVDLGVAFGPNGMGGPLTLSSSLSLFPAVSLNKYGDYVSVRSAGAGGTTVSLHWLLDVERSLSYLGGRLAASLISGPSISVEEEECESWLRSPMIIGGLESNEDLIDDFLVEVAAETSTGLCLMLGADLDSPAYYDGPPPPFVIETKTPLADTLTSITTKQLVEWDDSTSSHPHPPPPFSPAALIVDPDLLIRDRIIDDIAASPRSKMGVKFHEWMELFVGEPDFLKKRLAKNNAYDFPFVEQPFAATLLKHTGLWREVMFLISDSSEITRGRVASSSMRELWGKIKTLRGFLRRKRQLYLVDDQEHEYNLMCWNIRDRGEFLRGTKVTKSPTSTSDSPPRPSPLGTPGRKRKSPVNSGIGSPIRLVRVKSSPVGAHANSSPRPGVGDDMDLKEEHVTAVLKSCWGYCVVDVVFLEKTRAEEELALRNAEQKEEDVAATSRPPSSSSLLPPSPPDPIDLAALLARRKLRALSRCFGLRALYELLNSVSFSSAQLDSLIYFRDCLRGKEGGRIKKMRNKKLIQQQKEELQQAQEAAEQEQEALLRAEEEEQNQELHEPLLGSESNPTSNGGNGAWQLQPVPVTLQTPPIFPVTVSPNVMMQALTLNDSATDVNETRRAGRRGLRLRDTRSEAQRNQDANADVPAPPPSPPHSRMAGVAGEKSAKSNRGSEEEERKRKQCYYLKGLESCPTQYLEQVQQNYETLQTKLMELAKRAIDSKEIGFACSLFERFAIDYEPRDHRWLLDSGVLQLLKPLVSVVENLKHRSRRGTPPGDWAQTTIESFSPPTTSYVVSVVGSGLWSTRQVFDHLCGVLGSSSELYEDDEDELEQFVTAMREGDYTSTIKFYGGFYGRFQCWQKKQAERLEESRRAERVRLEDKKKQDRGVKYSYVVTASNGVGVRSFPHSSSPRTKYSFQADQIAEIDYRIKIPGDNGNTFLRLVGEGDVKKTGWLFDIGMRSPFQGRRIMKEVKVEKYAMQQEQAMQEQAKQIGGWSVPEGDDAADDFSRVYCGGLTVLHAGEPSGIIGDRSLSRHQSNYVEFIVRSGGTKSKIGIGVVGAFGKDSVPGEGLKDDFFVGSVKNSYGYTCWNEKVYAHGREVRDESERIGLNDNDETVVYETDEERDIIEELNMSNEDDREMEREDVGEEEKMLPNDTLLGVGIDFEAGMTYFTRDNKIVGVAASPRCKEDDFWCLPMACFGGDFSVLEVNYCSEWEGEGDFRVQLGEDARDFLREKKKKEEAAMVRVEESEVNSSKAGNPTPSAFSANVGTYKGLGEDDRKDSWGDDTDSDEVAMTSAEFGVLSTSSWALFKHLCRLVMGRGEGDGSRSSSSISSSDNSEKKIDSLTVIEERRARSESLYGSSSLSTKSTSRTLSNLLVSWLVEDVKSCLASLGDFGTAAKKGGEIWLEVITFSRIEFLLELAVVGEGVRAQLSDPNFLEVLFGLEAESKSPRVKRAVWELVVKLVPNMQVNLVEGVKC